MAFAVRTLSDTRIIITQLLNFFQLLYIIFLVRGRSAALSFYAVMSKKLCVRFDPDQREVYMSAFIDIKSVTGSDYRAVKQDLKFRTGKFLWRVVFNIALNPTTVNNQNLTVYNSSNQPVDTVISYNAELNSIEIEPKEAYAAGETYTLNVSTNVESRGGQRLKNAINIEFMV